MKKRDVTFFEHILGHPMLESFGLSPGWNILGEKVQIAQDTDKVYQEDELEGRVKNLITEAQKLNMAMASLACLTLSQDGEEADRDIWVRHMCLGKMMEFINEALRNWQDKRKKDKIFLMRKRKFMEEIFKEEELKDIEIATIRDDEESKDLEIATTTDDLIAAYEKIYKQLRIQYDITGDSDIENAIDKPNSKTWTQAMTSKNWQFWLKAAYDEITMIAKMNVFTLSRNILVGRKVLSAKWVWAVKRSAITGKIERFKARWVARGDLQRKGLDYKETFAPVASLITLRILLALAVAMDFEFDQMNIKSTFLNGLIDTLIFLKEPEGFQLDNSVCELYRRIYSLCQDARAWYEILNSMVQRWGFK